jgi:superfamily II DNA or RNA helicase
VRGVSSSGTVTVVSVQWHGNDVVTLTYKNAKGQVDQQLIYRDDESTLEVVMSGRPWDFDGDGHLFRLVSEAHRIRMAYLFDPLLAVHTSLVEPLPHQITAVYEEMLPRQPLRFLLADDPGAGKTIMAGLLIKELRARGDLQRCLVVAPGSLVEQWQDELAQKFQLPFEIMTNDKLEASASGNWFLENDLAIARLDKLSRNEDVQAKLDQTDWDLIVVDEAHKMSASFFGGEARYTKRYHLGQQLSRLTRHFLLMTATPHNGKEEDFQLFMALVDGDRFEGKFRDGVHTSDPSDLMRRMVKEQLVKFDGKPLFPERRAYAAPYTLSDPEAELYKEVTEYVREEFNRAEALESGGTRGTVGFALTILQRRLASSPEAIYQSLRRRRERLESKLREAELLRRGEIAASTLFPDLPRVTDEYLEDLDEAPGDEVEETEEQVVDRASAARTIDELKLEIESLQRLEQMAQRVLHSGRDRKWEELSNLLQSKQEMFDVHGNRRKLVIFTEHRDTLQYLKSRLSTLLGRPESIVTIQGGMGREDRRKAEQSFMYDPDVHILLATDAAGEGINLQRAHLMVNYDLPWNPNRLEQRFGRIHRIGQTEVCHLWNLVARETREGDVYTRLLEKLEQERQTLGGQVFDVLGKLTFDDRPLRELLVEAIRYGDRPDVRARLEQVIDRTMNRAHLQQLLADESLTHEVLSSSRVQEIRQQMEEAEARRLQPHYIASFFKEAFAYLGGTIRQREPDRYEVSHVPASVRNRDRQIGTQAPLLRRYDRITFDKDKINVPGKPTAAFICPGHPLLDATIDLILERHSDLLKRGTVLVADDDLGDRPRALFYLEHSIQDGRPAKSGGRTTVSRQMQFVEVEPDGTTKIAGYAPHLDYRPATEEELEQIQPLLDDEWLRQDIEAKAMDVAISKIVPAHLEQVRKRTDEMVKRTMAAVKERLTKEITYWDHRAYQLMLQEEAGKGSDKLNSRRAKERAEELSRRLKERMEELEQQRRISPSPPNPIGGALIVPAALLRRDHDEPDEHAVDPAARKRIEELAMNAVLDLERQLGFEPEDVSDQNQGWDITSRHPETGDQRFIEVKGRVSGARTITVTRNEIIAGLNKPDEFILAVVLVNGVADEPMYCKPPFRAEPTFSSCAEVHEIAKLETKPEAMIPASMRAPQNV